MAQFEGYFRFYGIVLLYLLLLTAMIFSVTAASILMELFGEKRVINDIAIHEHSSRLISITTKTLRRRQMVLYGRDKVGIGRSLDVLLNDISYRNILSLNIYRYTDMQ